MLKQNPFSRSPSLQRYIHQRHEVIEPAATSGKREWIVARSLCFYRLFDLTTIPAARRSEALKLKIQQWTPLKQYANYIVWQGALAQVWIWDAHKQAEQQQALQVKISHPIPESLLLPKLEEGIQLLQCSEGVEARYWQQSVLKHSRWWTTSPSLKQWSDFQRTCSLTIDGQIPTLSENVLLQKPWGYHRTSLNTIALQQESLWVLLGLAIFIIMLSWSSMSILKWQQAIQKVEQQIEALNTDATPILTAKTKAMQHKQKVDKLLKLNPYPHQLDLMGKVIDNLPSQQVRLVTWRYELSQLNFTVEGKSLDPRQYVKTYETIDWFDEVKTENTRADNQLIISMQVKPATTYSSTQVQKPLKRPAEEVQIETTNVGKVENPSDFDWSKVPIPDFNKLRN